jgi:hypothetical protein
MNPGGQVADAVHDALAGLCSRRERPILASR